MKIITQTSLFSDIPESDIKPLLECVNARYATYTKGEMIIWEGSIVDDIGIVLKGHARSIKMDSLGKLTILTLLGEGSHTGVLLAASRERKSPVSVQAKDALCLLTIPISKLIDRCPHSCQSHQLLLRNYINIIAEKSMVLHDRIDCLVRHSVREKILTYLLRYSIKNANSSFKIPLNRNDMAEYLNVERSALSRELSRMKKEGLIDYHKNEFMLL